MYNKVKSYPECDVTSDRQTDGHTDPSQQAGQGSRHPGPQPGPWSLPAGARHHRTEGSRIQEIPESQRGTPGGSYNIHTQDHTTPGTCTASPHHQPGIDRADN